MSINGELQSPFNLAKILLIPKKGSFTNILNWRPISLCEASYKLFAGAVASRLKKITERLCDTSQKGYSSSKNISEAVINIFNHIKSSKLKNIKIATISLDFSKAFDKLSHEFILKSLEFFNFGPVFINLIKTILSNRYAYIQNLDNHTLRFLIGSGVPQGLAPSGYLFIIALEILLLKIIAESKLFKHIIENNTPENRTDNIPPTNDIVPIQNIANPGRDEVTGTQVPETSDKAGYADDITLMILPTPENIYLFKAIMDEFHELSGLSTNYSKTKIMFCSPPSDECREAVKNIGLKITSISNVLGYKFDSSLNEIGGNIDDVIKSMSDSINFWNTFYLSLPGRINIWRSMIMSKLGYLLTVLSPSHLQIEKVNSLMAKFIIGSLKISSEKLFLPVYAGGLGLTDCYSYSTILKFNLYKRSINSTDSWAAAIKLSCLCEKNRIYNLNHEIFEHFPFSKIILKAYLQVHNAYYLQTKNILSASIHDYNFFRFASGAALVQTYAVNLARVQLRQEHLCETNPLSTAHTGKTATLGAITLRNPPRCASKAQIANILGCHIADGEFSSIRALINFILKKFPTCGNFGYNPLSKLLTKKCPTSKIIMPILSFCDPLKKLASNKGTIARYNTINKKIAQDNLVRESSLISIWKESRFDNSFKTFAYQFTQNILFTNAQKSKFIRNYSPACNLCISLNFRPPPKENGTHMFIYCPVVSQLRQEFIARLNLNSQDQNIAEMTMCGSTDPSPTKRFTINTILMLFNFILYKKRNIPNIKIQINCFLSEIENMLEILKNNSSQRIDLENLLGYNNSNV